MQLLERCASFCDAIGEHRVLFIHAVVTILVERIQVKGPSVLQGTIVCSGDQRLQMVASVSLLSQCCEHNIFKFGLSLIHLHRDIAVFVLTIVDCGAQLLV